MPSLSPLRFHGASPLAGPIDCESDLQHVLRQPLHVPQLEMNCCEVPYSSVMTAQRGSVFDS